MRHYILYSAASSNGAGDSRSASREAEGTGPTTPRQPASDAKKEVGRKVRRTIKELGGTMPESLATTESIKQVERREKKRLKPGK